MNCVTHFCNHDGFANAINFKVVHLFLSTLIQFIMSMVRMLDVNSEIGVHVLDSVFWSFVSTAVANIHMYPEFQYNISTILMIK